jgi:plasmid maintenance system antidote protein VapI
MSGISLSTTEQVSQARSERRPEPPRQRPFDRAGFEKRLAAERLRVPREIISAITFFMAEEDISRAELGRRMNVSAGRVSQILSGDENLTLKTLATVAAALDAHLEASLEKDAAE